MSERTLYHTQLSPFCRKSRIHLAEKGLDFTLVEEPVWEEREEFFRLNPAGEVPVLLDGNMGTISGSYAISEYLDEQYEESNLLGDTVKLRTEVRRLVTWFDVKFYQEVSQHILFEKVFRKLLNYGQPDSDAIRVGRQNILHHLDYIAYLTEERTWLAGDQFTLADITAAAHLSVIDYLGDIHWDANPEVKEWYALIKSRPSFRALLLDRIRGFRPPHYYDNPDF